ncbi:MAG: hypothetical protein IID45_08425, partial [Planctomycetes bacterium]|nr:hypothetical protein [Planctomycetota bacterium]
MSSSPTPQLTSADGIAAYRPYAVSALAVIAVIGLVAWAAGDPRSSETPTDVPGDLDSVVGRVNRHLEKRWRNAKIEAGGEVRKSSVQPASSAQQLQVLRRLSLALHGTIPSLEEIRKFEADE